MTVPPPRPRRRRGWPTLLLVLVALVAVVALMIADRFRSPPPATVTGKTSGSHAPAPQAPPSRTAVVLGDSTAAGAGLPLIHGASRVASACGRSADSYARDLAAAGRWRVVNLACSGATVGHGLLGPQSSHGLTVPAQLAAAGRVRHVSLVIVSVGADDLDWGAMVFDCALTRGCTGPASAASFRPALATFRTAFRSLLARLAGYPGHPRVIINEYYNPFGSRLRCLSDFGLSAHKLRLLRSRLASLNGVLARGAAREGFTAVRPDFSGHGLCSNDPYVQSLLGRAPFHPTVTGQRAIALADLAALSH